MVGKQNQLQKTERNNCDDERDTENKEKKVRWQYYIFTELILSKFI